MRFRYLFILCFFYGCAKDLDKYPETGVSDASYWKTAADLQNACNYLYLSLKGIGAMTDANRSNDNYGSTPNSISDGSRLAGSTSWGDKYDLIRSCNNILEKSAGVNADAAIIDRYRGEAHFFRAMAYFDLVKCFGDVPLILRTFDVFDTLMQAHRSPREQVIDSAYADLDFAIAKLPGASAMPAAEYGRITRGAALALKAQLALFEGAWNKFHHAGDAEKHLKIAINASDSIINSGNYGLFTYGANKDSSYYYLFRYEAEGSANKENILVRLYGQNITNDIASHNQSRNLENGQVTPTRELMDAYLYMDGLPKDKSPLYKAPVNTLTEFENRDPRMGMTVFNKSVWFISNNYVPTFSLAPTGYKIRKYFITADWGPSKSYVDYIIIRYAEILLINAEAKYELNGSISDADLDRTINLLRARVKMPALTNAFVAANSLDMREEIRRERRIELAVENDFRYWDLIRWKTAEIELPKPVLGARYFPKEQSGITNPRLTADSVVIVQDASKRKFDPKRDYLWPIPLTDLGLDLNLTQNEGW